MTYEQLMQKRIFFESAFVSIGRTPENVTEALRTLVIKGVPNSLCGCPISKWIKTLDADVSEVLVQVSHIVIRFGHGEDMTHLVVEPTPALRFFISEFDAQVEWLSDLVEAPCS